MMQARLDSALATVLHDVPPGVLDHERFSVHAVSRGEQPAPEGLEPEEWLDAGETGVGILRIDSNYSRLDTTGDAQLVAAIASLVQDAVIDDSGRAWPLSPDGRVLDVVVEGGAPVWWDRGDVRVPIGELEH